MSEAGWVRKSYSKTTVVSELQVQTFATDKAEKSKRKAEKGKRKAEKSKRNADLTYLFFSIRTIFNVVRGF